MSTTIPAPARPASPARLALSQAAGRLAATAVHAFASVVLRRAANQAHRELAALDNRALADIGIARAELMPLLDTLARARATSVLAQFP